MWFPIPGRPAASCLRVYMRHAPVTSGHRWIRIPIKERAVNHIVEQADKEQVSQAAARRRLGLRLPDILGDRQPSDQGAEQRSAGNVGDEVLLDRTRRYGHARETEEADRAGETASTIASWRRPTVWLSKGEARGTGFPGDRTRRCWPRATRTASADSSPFDDGRRAMAVSGHSTNANSEGVMAIT